MHGPLLILAFFVVEGRGEARRNFPKQRLTWQKGRWLEVRSRRKKASRFPCCLDEIHHHKVSMTDLTIPGSLPFEELRSYPSSKRLEKAKFVLPRKSGKISQLRHNFLGNYAAELHNFLGNYAAAAKFPSCRISCDTGIRLPATHHAL